jgi:hypothetical protein
MFLLSTELTTVLAERQSSVCILEAQLLWRRETVGHTHHGRGLDVTWPPATSPFHQFLNWDQWLTQLYCAQVYTLFLAGVREMWTKSSWGSKQPITFTSWSTDIWKGDYQLNKIGRGQGNHFRGSSCGPRHSHFSWATQTMVFKNIMGLCNMCILCCLSI